MSKEVYNIWSINVETIRADIIIQGRSAQPSLINFTNIWIIVAMAICKLDPVAFSYKSIVVNLILLSFIDPILLPEQRVDKGAIRFILSGANIMCRGLTSPGATLSHAEKEDVVVSL